MAERRRLPSFDLLPLDSNGPPGNAWGLFGSTDELGMLNLLTPENTKVAAAEIQEGIRISLDLSLNKPAFPSFDRPAFQHKIIQRGPRSVNDDVLHFNTQSSSQWDGFRHYGYQKSKQYFQGNTQKDISESNAIGIDVWLENGGIVGRGVLLDYGTWAEKNSIPIQAFRSTPITLENLKQVAIEQKVEFRSGDILLIRSGFLKAFETLSDMEQLAISTRASPDFIGVEAGKEKLRWLWDHEFSAVAGDAPSFERAPIAGPHANLEEMLHQWLLGGWGMPIGELFDLEKLAKECIRLNRWSFFLASVPLRVPGGVASPPNAIAIL